MDIDEAEIPADYSHLTLRKVDETVTLLDGLLKQSPSSTQHAPKTQSTAKRRAPIRESTPAIMQLLGLGQDQAKASTSRAPTFPTPAAEIVDPYSLPSLQARLGTFKIASYSDKPRQIDALAAARHGWSNMRQGERERLVCEACKAMWKVEGGTNNWRAKDSEEKIARLQQRFVQDHRSGCTWRTRQCSETLLKLPLASPSILMSQILARALILHDLSLPPDLTLPINPKLSALPELSPLSAKLNALHSRTSARSLSRASTPERQSTAPPEIAFTQIHLLFAMLGWKPLPLPSTGRIPIVQCEFCLRQAALHSKDKKLLDPLNGHRPFCPYVTESGGQKGWEGVCHVLLHGLGQERSKMSDRIVGREEGKKTESRLEMMMYVRDLLGPGNKRVRIT